MRSLRSSWRRTRSRLMRCAAITSTTILPSSRTAAFPNSSTTRNGHRSRTASFARASPPKAVRHLALFNMSAALVERMEPDRLQEFLESEYFDTNPTRDALNANNERFYALSESEDLVALNAAWLRSLPGLKVRTADEIEAEVARRGAALPDREERERAAIEAEPRYIKLIRALCGAAGHELSDVTAGDPSHEHNGKHVVAWHFITDKGHHYMVDADGKAMMFNGTTEAMVTEIEAA